MISIMIVELKKLLNKTHQEIGAQMILGGVNPEKIKELESISTVIKLLEADNPSH